MLEQISELVKQYGKEAVIDNPDIPNEHNNAVLAEATSTITGGMQNMLAGGGRYCDTTQRREDSGAVNRRPESG